MNHATHSRSHNTIPKESLLRQPYRKAPCYSAHPKVSAMLPILYAYPFIHLPKISMSDSSNVNEPMYGRFCVTAPFSWATLFKSDNSLTSSTIPFSFKYPADLRISEYWLAISEIGRAH